MCNVNEPMCRFTLLHCISIRFNKEEQNDFLGLNQLDADQKLKHYNLGHSAIYLLTMAFNTELGSTIASLFQSL